ncbi:MAG: phenylalanine--tRNA ligase subunit beta [Bradymonadales bacterium]|nr:phenylalanine--tRNA ligase subunit beta [Bradymonadales bacterium]
MKLSYNWLCEHVELDGLTPREVADRLTLSGLEVEAVEPIGVEYHPIKVGQILQIRSHPQADKLVLCQVEFGSGPCQIVCGASNIREGDRVPVIPAGQRLPDGTKISKGKIRGEISHGMLCSATELALPGDPSGIMILSPAVPVGKPLAEVLHLTDTVLDLSVTPNRGDCLSMMGVAREVAALFGRPRRYPGMLAGGELQADKGQEPAERHARVEIEDVQGCPRYAAAIMLEVTVGPAPDWMARRLTAVGLRPVNNLVDVTNYVMWETGQPLHVFDLERIRRHPAEPCHILVRSARSGEQMESIDHLVRTLDPEDLVITDGQHPIALAGVMGGVESEVSESTRQILIECAHFQPSRIRRTAKRLGMNSESSYRFERTVDIEGAPRVLARTVELVLQTDAGPAGRARVARGIVDAYPRPWRAKPVAMRVDRANALLGAKYTAEEMRQVLEGIEIEVVESSPQRLVTIPPSFRPDLEREVDLVEEVGRLVGLDRIEARLPASEMGFEHTPREGGTAQTVVPYRRIEQLERIRDRLAAAGISEAINYSFVSPGAIAALGYPQGDRHGQPVELANPLSEEWSVLRTSLLPGLLANVRHNLAHREPTIALFEVGAVFFADDSAGNGTGVREEQRLAGVLCGRRGTAWLGEVRDHDIFDLKGVVSNLLSQFAGDPGFENHGGAIGHLHPGVGALVTLAGQTIGVIGQIHPLVAERFDIASPVYLFELELDRLVGLGESTPQYQPFSRYPAATRDLALVVDHQLPYGEVERAIRGFANPLIEGFVLASIYEGEQIPADKKCVALAVTYRSLTSSLTEEKIDGIHGRLARFLCERLPATFR